VPQALAGFLQSPDREGAARVLKAMLGMKKIVISELEAAFLGK